MAIHYDVGDKVESHPDSSDVTDMKAIYIGEIAEVVEDNNAGGCYIIYGKFVPISTNGKIDKFWENRTPVLGSRQLHGDDIILKGSKEIL